MKNIFKYSILATLIVAMSGLTACQQEELDTDQYAGKLALAAIAPNPVMRGAQLRVIGANLDKVTEVRFAGGATVTSIEKVAAGERSEIRLTVPMDAAVGPVTVVTSDGTTASTRFDLEYTEPIVFSSFAPATVLSGDVVTIKGEYLNNVREVILGGGVYVTEFNSQSGSELSFKVPSNAISGYVIIGDVNEIEDQNTIPNQIYSGTELVVGDPTVAVADTTTYKSGDVITVSGSHLDMIEKINLTGAADVEFKLAEDGNSISFNLPPSASDGQIVLTSFAAKEFQAGAIISLNVTDLEVASLAEDGRYKAGSDVSITGSDLDLVTKVEFTGAEAQWYLDGKNIVATVPAGAKDGGLTVTLASGKQAYSSEIAVVKPVATAVDKNEAVAGQTNIVVTGTDLDLVTGVTIGDKEHGFIDCKFDILTADSVKVAVSKDAYTGPLTLTAANGDNTATEAITVTYDEAVSVTFAQPSFALGKKIAITGKNLLNVEQLFIKGKKVVSYAVRGDDNMSFDIPEGIGPGVYRLAMVLIDGTELTWPVPFEITAPFTEKTIWEGSEIVTGWSGKGFAEQDAFIKAGIKESDVVRVYFNAPEGNWWDIQLVDGHWSNLSVPELDGGNEIKSDFYPSGSQMFSFAVTPEILAQLTKIDTWGNAFIINGDGNIEITRISLIQFGAVEEKTAIWEGSQVVDWSGGAGEDNKAMTALSWGGYDWSTVEAGTKIVLEFTPTADEVQIRFSNGSWAAHPGTPDPYKLYGESKLEIELTKEILDNMVATGGLVITGQGFTLTGVYLVTTGEMAPVGTPIWEGSFEVDWSGGLGDDHKAMTALSWGGYDWSTVEAGTTIVLEFTPTADEVQIRFSNGSWAAHPGTQDPYKLYGESSLEIELTQAILDEMIANGGLVITGQGYTLTAVILK
ncbi:MAG: hypothetical protein J5907_00160 [Bacteroidales bacterium]|nr:hypothetical protein [Bacteroidales bacterium]